MNTVLSRQAVPSAALPLFVTAALALTSSFMLAQEAEVATKDERLAIPAQKREAHLLVEIRRLPELQIRLSDDVVAPPLLSEDAYFQKEASFVRSADVMAHVVDRLDLTQKWNGQTKARIVRRLTSEVSVNLGPSPCVFTIRMKGATEEEARMLAEAVAESYTERRTSQFREQANRKLTALDNEIRSQEDLVEEKRKLYHTICKAIGLVIPMLLAEEQAGQFIADHLAAIKEEKGQAGAVDFALQSQDLYEAYDEFRAGKKLLNQMKEQHARARIAMHIPHEPLSVLGYK